MSFALSPFSLSLPLSLSPFSLSLYLSLSLSLSLYLYIYISLSISIYIYIYICSLALPSQHTHTRSILPFVLLPHPCPGTALSVLLLSWLYAYYCFDYQWALQGTPLAERLDFFERRWAFFAGGWCETGIKVLSLCVCLCLCTYTIGSHPMNPTLQVVSSW